MPADADFLRLILADPDADGPRLVYADWLADQGQTARAEFIRTQCALAALPVDEPRVAALQARADVLLEQHRIAWSGPLAGLATRWDWHRGFPEFVRVESRIFFTRGEDLFAAVPVRHVELLKALPSGPVLEQSPLLSRLAGLTIASHLDVGGDVVAQFLGASPHLAGLRSLHLLRHGLTAVGARALVAGRFEKLTTLVLTENRIDQAGACALAAATTLASLTTLGLRGNPLGPDGANAVLASDRLVNLTTLDLAETGCTAAALAAAPPMAGRLTSLSLAGNDLGDLGVQHLCRWPLTNLRDLNLSRTGLGDDGAAALADANLPALRRLVLNGNRMTEVGKRLLAGSPFVKGIPALEMSDNWSAAPVR